MSKGSQRRPRLVSYQQYADNWNAAFTIEDRASERSRLERAVRGGDISHDEYRAAIRALSERIATRDK